MAREWAEILRQLHDTGEASFTRRIEGRTYTRRFAAPERLILLGGGHVARAVSRLAAGLDFAVTVVDDRPEFADRARFPEAAEVLCADFAAAVAELRIRQRDFVCVLTRGHEWDGVCLRALLSGETLDYLGLMGSRNRCAVMRDTLKKEGFPESVVSAIHAPIGVPIHAVTPSEIAVSIAAELIETRRSRPVEPGTLEQRDADPAVLQMLADGGAAFALVLERDGSAPAHTGALLAADRTGRTAGTVGGGWIEAEAVRRAVGLLGTGRRELLPVNLNGENQGGGMVCGGHMVLLLEDVPEEAET